MQVSNNYINIIFSESVDLILYFTLFDNLFFISFNFPLSKQTCTKTNLTPFGVDDISEKNVFQDLC